jgi:hypothetical protein
MSDKFEVKYFLKKIRLFLDENDHFEDDIKGPKERQIYDKCMSKIFDGINQADKEISRL